MGQREGRGRGGLRTLGSGNYCTDSGRKSTTAVASKREGALGTGQGPGEDGGGKPATQFLPPSKNKSRGTDVVQLCSGIIIIIIAIVQ